VTTPLILATRNPGKLREIRALLADLPVEVLPLPEDAPEVEETAETFAGNAELKARGAARCSVFVIRCSAEMSRGLPSRTPNTEDHTPNTPFFVLADDSGLEVDALGGGPGVYSARYAGPGASDAACVAKLLAELQGVPEAARTARFRCAMALLAPDQRLWIVEGTLEGEITHSPRGHNGFGYDPVFLVPDLGRTTAELAPEEKNRISHRGQALAKVADLLRRLL
jgi:XTP/dITP diphosphohydrolase